MKQSGIGAACVRSQDFTGLSARRGIRGRYRLLMRFSHLGLVSALDTSIPTIISLSHTQ